MLTNKIEIIILYFYYAHNKTKQRMKSLPTLIRKCSECKIEIDDEYNGEQNVMYRCGDSEVCSLSCSKSRICKIITYDPYLNNPMYWQIISDIKPKHSPIKRSSSKKTLTDDNFVINIVELDIIPEEEANQDGVCDRYYHCYTLRETLITLLLQSMIYVFDVIIEIFY